MASGRKSGKFNAGTGLGFSVREVLRAVEEVTGQPVPYEIGPKRDGDPPLLVADSGSLMKDFGWTPRYSDIRTIVETAWRWEMGTQGDSGPHKGDK